MFKLIEKLITLPFTVVNRVARFANTGVRFAGNVVEGTVNLATVPFRFGIRKVFSLLD